MKTECCNHCVYGCDDDTPIIPPEIAEELARNMARKIDREITGKNTKVEPQTVTIIQKMYTCKINQS